MVSSFSFVHEVLRTWVNALLSVPRPAIPSLAMMQGFLSLPCASLVSIAAPTAPHSRLSRVSTRPKVRRNNWKYQSGLLPESQGAGGAERPERAPHMLYGLLAPKRVALPCRPVAVCRKGLLGDEQTDEFPLENGVLQRKMAQSGASGGAAPGRGA